MLKSSEKLFLTIAFEKNFQLHEWRWVRTKVFKILKQTAGRKLRNSMNIQMTSLSWTIFNTRHFHVSTFIHSQRRNVENGDDVKVSVVKSFEVSLQIIWSIISCVWYLEGFSSFISLSGWDQNDCSNWMRSFHSQPLEN